MALPATQHPPSSQIRALTDEDLQTIPADGNRYELINGEIRMSPAPSTLHQTIVVQLTELLNRQVREGGLGAVFVAPFDVKLSRHLVLQPDLLFVARDRLSIVSESGVNGAPDLVIEVLSPSSRQFDTGAKASLYADYGVREYWIVDPNDKTISVHALRDGRYELINRPTDAASSHILPSLTIRSADLFDLPSWLLSRPISDR
ncbi:MAG: Uma2 family endonuclease [Thermomicrobiales bacterium]|nr:Uma2 family endonuclease [Thermomicrobiales bacterium]